MRSSVVLVLCYFCLWGCASGCRVKKEMKRVLKQQNKVIEMISKSRADKGVVNELSKSSLLMSSEEVLGEGLRGIKDSNERIIGGYCGGY